MIAINTGMRISEIAALKWDDIDFINKIIEVSKSISRVNGKLIESTTKTKNGIRNIPINDTLYCYLKKQYCNNNNYYVISNTNKPKDIRGISKLMKDCVKN